jgi:hypothetical protein
MMSCLKCRYLKLSIVDSPQKKNEDLILSDNFLRQNRIIHHAQIFMLGGESYRLKNALNEQKKFI